MSSHRTPMTFLSLRKRRRNTWKKKVPAHRIAICRDKPALPTNDSCLVLQPSQNAWNQLICRVQTFAPSTLRCCSLDIFASCNCSLCYTRCSNVNHTSNSGKVPEKCTNCNGKISAFSRLFPTWYQEKKNYSCKSAPKTLLWRYT